ncbi:S-layer homology domain-containing protein [Paenibacillus sp. SAFN-117]|uniref:S-layer homology domain-containing protein n=1 Tax=Paenibacillus sp. SAFN-117 TaxID=3436860 RepID=UPI003F7DF1E8
MLSNKNNQLRGRDRNLFKASVMKKMSGLLATLMIVSILTPLLAFASGFGAITYKANGNVTGSVYFDGVDYDALKDQDYVTLAVYDEKGKIQSIIANKDTSRNVTGIVYFNISGTITDATYTKIKLKYNDDVVSDWVYRETSGGNPGGSYPGGGFGGPIGGIVDLNGKADANRLANLLKENKNASLEIQNDFVLLPASALVEGETLTIYNENTSFTLPIKALKLQDLAKEMGVELEDLWIRVEMKEVKDSALKAIEDAVKALNAKLLATPYDFKVTAEAGDKTKAITSFGSTYTNSSINFEGKADANKATGVVANSNALAFAPSLFSNDGDNSKVTIKRNGTGVYAAIETDISFNDVASHWAKSYVDLLSHKLIVDGYEDGSFGPERSITRAEFAAIIARSLGLDTSASSSSTFSDVQSGDWYAGVVNAAVQSGIVDGYEDGTFRPNAQINREELAAMVVRALAYVGKDVKVSSTEQDALLAKFADADSIVWGQAELAAAVKAGIVDGMTDTSIAPRNDATRAQAATMLNRLLNNAGFIN